MTCATICLAACAASVSTVDAGLSSSTTTQAEANPVSPGAVWTPSRWDKTPVRAAAGRLPSVAGGGDVNGDGFSDIVVGGPLEADGHGQVLTYLGSTVGLPDESNWRIEGWFPNQHLGLSVALADLNGDLMYDIVVVGNTNLSSGLPGGISIHLFLGSSNGWSNRPASTIDDGTSGLNLFPVIAAVGDLNGDGLAELGVAVHDPALTLEGELSLAIFEGASAGMAGKPAWILHGEQPDCGFASSFGSAGDVDGDGFGDLLVGAPRYGSGRSKSGKVYLYLGADSESPLRLAWQSEYPLPFNPREDGDPLAFFGYSVAGGGDVNRDGFPDLLVGAWNGGHGDAAEGIAFLFLGSRDGFPPSPAWFAEGNHSHVHLGATVQGDIDFDRDGYTDVVVGVPNASHGQKDEGAVLFYPGSAAGPASRPSWTTEGERSNGHLGQFVGSAGDVNGDGFEDLLLAGLDYAISVEPILRVLVIPGPPGRWVGSSGWSPHKPFLVALERRLENLSSRTAWLAAFLAALLLITGLTWVQLRLRKQLSRLLADHRQLATAQERTRIARDIHDHLGADLTRLTTQLDRVKERDVEHMLNGLRQSAHEAAKTLDELVWATNPAQDTLEGLANYLAEYVPSYLDADGIACDLDLPLRFPQRILPADLRHNLFLIVKEAIHNVVQHAHATRVGFGISLSGHGLRLSIADNGRGLATDPSEEKERPSSTAHTPPDVTAGHGLRNIRARVAEMRGTFNIGRSPAGGTELSITVPLGQP